MHFNVTTISQLRRSRPRKLHRRHRFIALVVLVLAAALSQLATSNSLFGDSNQRPNIVLIMADDIGYECFGCYGSKQYQTPNIDRIAETGIRFTHCYSQPLCTPSRTKLMTGLSNARNYSAFSILNRDQKTIGHYFRDAGYATAIAGKWQLYGAEHYADRFRAKGTLPHAAGFQNACLWQVDQLGERFHGPLMYMDGTNQQFEKAAYGPQIAAQYLTRFIRKNRDKPFFVYYPMILVHSPFVPTPDSASLSSKNRQSNFEDMVAYMDKLVGQIVETIEEVGISERTLVLFTGDNGTHQSLTSRLNGRTIQGGKAMTTDAGTRVPLVAHWPGVIESGQVCRDLVDFSDFLPTAMDAIGHTVGETLDGRSFLPQLRGKPGTPRESIYCYYCPRPQRTKPVRFVRDQRWKLYGDGLFFDVENDILEQRPLGNIAAGSPADLAKQKLMHALASMPLEGQALLQFAK